MSYGAYATAIALTLAVLGMMLVIGGVLVAGLFLPGVVLIGVSLIGYAAAAVLHMRADRDDVRPVRAAGTSDPA